MRGAVTVIEVGVRADGAATVAWFSMEIWPPFESVMSLAVTVTEPVCPEDSAVAVALIWLEAPFSSRPSKRNELEWTVTEPALPEEKVMESIEPLLTSERSPATVTSTLPALPVLPGAAWLLMPVRKLLPCPSMAILPALTLTVPASPLENVMEEIRPALTMERCLVDVTSTLPALPVLPSMASLEMPVALSLSCTSMAILPALTLTVPASPLENVSEEIRLPLTMERLPDAATSTLPALPVLPGFASLEMPVA